ncbi:MAG: protein kinase [Planctomycetota bacterium]
MELARLRRLNDLYRDACALAGEQRAAFLARLRDEDAAMAAELTALLDVVARNAEADDGDGSALGQLVGGAALSAACLDLQAIADGLQDLGVPSDAIAGFRLLRRIGQGGMGVVYEAEQDNPRRRVALKLMQPSLGTERLRRFELEGAVLGRLHHPNIAQIFTCGTFRGALGDQPFLVMELIDGVDLRTHAGRAKLGLPERLALFAQVADGVHHAHGRGVVHRDLKPDNVLVDSLGTAKVLDFGVARAKDSSLDLTSMATRAGELIGTLSYMAPEQLAGNPDAITARSDIYSLGVMLYELLSNRLPHEVAGLPIAAAIHILTDEPPAPLARLDARLRGDLATIVAKAMGRDPARRYATAADFAADIRRHLEHRPIQARPASITYRVRTMVRRNRGLATGLGAAFAAMLLGLGATVWQAQARGVERDRALRQTYSANVIAAGDAIARAEFAAGRAFLEAAPASLRGWEWRVLMAQLDTSVEVEACEVALPQAVWNLDLLPVAGGTKFWIATMADLMGDPSATPGTAELWDRHSGQRLAKWTGACNWTLSADGRWLHGCRVLGTAPQQLQVATYDANTGARQGERIVDVPEAVPWYQQANWPGACSPAGDTCWFAAEAGVGRANLLQQEANRVRAILEPGQVPFWFAFSPDGKVLATAPASIGPVRVFDPQTMETIALLSGHTGGLRSIVFSPDGTLLVSTSGDQSARVWDLTTKPPSCRVLQHPLQVDRAVFSPDQRLLATVCLDRMIRVFTTAEGALVETFGTSKLLSNGVAFFDNHTVAGVESDGSVCYWDVNSTATTVLRGHRAPVEFLALVPDLGIVVSSGVEGFRGQRDGLKFWDLDSGDLVAECLGPELVGKHLCVDGASDSLYMVQHSPPGASQRGVVRIHLRSGVRTLLPLAMLRGVLGLAPSAQDLAIAVTGMFPAPEDRELRIVDARTGAVRRRGNLSLQPFSLHWSRDGSWILAAQFTAGNHGAVLVDAQSLRELRHFPCPHALTFAVSPDERVVAIAGNDARIRLFERATGERIAELRGHDLAVYSLAFSPDGTRLASSGHDRGIRLWDMQTFEPVARLSGHEDTVMAFVWDGNERLISCGHDDVLRIWETAPVRTRVQARNARREAVARMEPMVAALFADLGDGARVRERIDADASLAPLDRKVARQVALRLALGANAVK